MALIVKKDKQKKTEQGGDIKSEEEKQQKQLPEDDSVASKLFSSVSCYKCTLFLSNDIIPAALIGDLEKKKKTLMAKKVQPGMSLTKLQIPTAWARRVATEK